jgi:hypothetical protein
MSKFKFKLKLQGLELEMEGAREDIPSMASSLGSHLAGLMQPAAEMSGEKLAGGLNNGMKTIDHSEGDSAVSPKKKKKRPASSASNKEGSSDAIEWQHDPTKYANPLQSWNPTKKALWLLYVVSQERKLTQLSTAQIANTFNKKFKQAGAVRGSNISRDLGKAKTRNPSLAQEDTTKTPPEWYLTDAGIKEAQASIEEARQA